MKINIRAWLVLTLLAPLCHAAGIDPALTTPTEQARQRQLESQEQQRQQEILKSLRQQQEIKPGVRDDIDALKQTTLKASIEIPDNETPCFTINKIELVDDDAARFQLALDASVSYGKSKLTTTNDTQSVTNVGSTVGSVQGDA